MKSSSVSIKTRCKKRITNNQFSNNGELTLWAEALRRAVNDIKTLIDSEDKLTIGKWLTSSAEITKWFSSKRDEIGSFVWICKLLNTSPSYVLDKSEVNEYLNKILKIRKQEMKRRMLNRRKRSVA